MKKIVRGALTGAASVGMTVMLGLSSHCASARPLEKSFAELANKFLLIPTGAPDSDMLARASAALNHLKRMELPEASTAINQALQLDARNSQLHFFNGFIYHLQARQGDAQKIDMAIEGYEQALRMDPGNWIAQEFLGLAYQDLRQYPQAREHFAEALLMAPDSTISIYGMMVSSYMTGDAVMACAMADRFGKVERAPDEGYARSSVAVYAACGEFDKAEGMRAALADGDREAADLDSVDRRLSQWKALYRDGAQPAMINAGLALGTGGQHAPAAAAASSRPEAPKPAAAAPAVPDHAAAAVGAAPRMVLVDVVLVSTQELITSAKGINLLNALTLQLGSPSAPAFSRSGSDSLVAGVASSSTVITRALTVPALAYSLNIANAQNTQNEVLARPTLAAVEGMPSEFFSGTNLNAAVTSVNSLGAATAVPVDKRFGVKLAVTPQFVAGGMVQLKVEAQRTFLNANTDSTGFAYRLEISETSANANVVMKLGDTLVLSGLSEKESSSSRNGVPVLQDVPILQYLFAAKHNSDFQRSVLMLITPRPPLYTARAGEAQSGPAGEALKALREKMGFSDHTPSNVESVLNHLRSTNLFREFRQGDVSLARWDRMGATGERLRQALEFLYY